MKSLLAAWQFWALLSASFAALTAIFAKVGVENVNSDYATFIRTLVVIAALAGLLSITGQWQSPGEVSTAAMSSFYCRAWAPARRGCAISAP